MLVLVAERLRPELFGQVQIPEGSPTSHDGHAEEGVHRRVMGWKSVGVGMAREIGQPDRGGLADHEAQDPVAPWRWPDAGPELRVDSVGDEALQEATVRRQYADGGVPRTDDLRRDEHHAIQHAPEGGLGDERGGRDYQAFEAVLGAGRP